MEVPRPARLEGAFDDPTAIHELVAHGGPYASIASYLPPAATGVRVAEGAPADVLPWFRSNWAVNGRASVAGADAILHNRRFVEAARRFLDVPAVTPSTVVVNVNAPMRAGAIHVDIPSFRGATREWCPLPLLQTMGASGLFEPWRVVEVGIVTWFYSGRGGAYDYWPDGLAAPMASVQPPFDNVALVADNDRMFHRIGWVGAEDAPSPAITADATIDHDTDGWTVRDRRRNIITYRDDDVRISILWKARATDDRGPAPALTPDHIVDVFRDDLEQRGNRTVGGGAELLHDETWLQQIHDTYYVEAHPASPD